MKIIEALKKQKDLARKVDDLKDKIAKHSAHLDYESPVYKDQKAQVAEWVQACSDLLKETLALRLAVQKTNLAIPVTIELDGKQVTKTIAEWVHRRRDLAKLERDVYAKLTDRGLREGQMPSSQPGQVNLVKIVRCYDPAARDAKLASLDSEPSLIDARLEIVNATTDLVALD